MTTQEKIDALRMEKEMVRASKRAKEEAREHARLLTEWADEKTLQRRYGDAVWDDYEGKWYPTIYNVADWRVKPEPRTRWVVESSGISSCDPSFPDFWRQLGETVTEWQEVLP